MGISPGAAAGIERLGGPSMGRGRGEAPREVVRVSPSPVREGSGEGACPLPSKKNCTFDSEITTFLCILTRFLKLGLIL